MRFFGIYRDSERFFLQILTDFMIDYVFLGFFRILKILKGDLRTVGVFSRIYAGILRIQFLKFLSRIARSISNGNVLHAGMKGWGAVEWDGEHGN